MLTLSEIEGLTLFIMSVVEWSEAEESLSKGARPTSRTGGNLILRTTNHELPTSFSSTFYYQLSTAPP